MHWGHGGPGCSKGFLAPPPPKKCKRKDGRGENKRQKGKRAKGQKGKRAKGNNGEAERGE
jgi:hypothetical protein